MCENCVRILDEEKHRQIRMFVILWKKWKKLASSSINQRVKSQKQCVHSTILLLRQKVCVKRQKHQFTIVLNNWTFREFCIKTLVWRHTKSNWFSSWSQLTIQCVFASLSGPAIDVKKMPIFPKKIIFLDEAHFDLGGYVNKQNCRIWGKENPHAYIEKPIHPKRVTVWCGFWSRGIIKAFFSKMSMEWPLQSMVIVIERIFVHKNWRGGYWQHLVSTRRRYVPHSRSYTRCFCVLFLKIALTAAELMSFGHLGAVIWHRWTIICGVP